MSKTRDKVTHEISVALRGAMLCKTCCELIGRTDNSLLRLVVARLKQQLAELESYLDGEEKTDV